MGKAAGRKVHHTVLLTASAEEQVAPARGQWVARLRLALASVRPWLPPHNVDSASPLVATSHRTEYRTSQFPCLHPHWI